MGVMMQTESLYAVQLVFWDEGEGTIRIMDKQPFLLC